mgnify:CR=1 FL=1
MLGECWIWPRGKNGKQYGAVMIDGVQRYAHRVVFEAFFGAIAKDLTLDHLCRNHSCVNPYHMEAVTSVENVMRGESPHAKNARKLRCPKGHAYDMPRKSGRRGCRTCQRQHGLKYVHRIRGLDTALHAAGKAGG